MGEWETRGLGIRGSGLGVKSNVERPTSNFQYGSNVECPRRNLAAILRRVKLVYPWFEEDGEWPD